MNLQYLIEKCEDFYTKNKNKKTTEIINLCKSFLNFSEILRLSFSDIDFPDQDKNISIRQQINDSFLSKLATIEFGYNGWIFAGGSHKPLTQKTERESQKFGKIYGQKFGKKIILGTGASGGFMDAVNSGYTKTGQNAITSTTRFSGMSEKINDKIKYCFISSTFCGMESFLIHNSIAGIFFDGGVGTAYEVFSMLCERQRGSIRKDTPMIFVETDSENVFYNNIKTLQQECETSGFNIMHQSCKIYPEDSKNIYSVKTSEEAVQILDEYIEQNLTLKEDIEHDFIREIFEVGEDKFVG